MKETDLQREVLSVLAQTIADTGSVEIAKYEVNAFDETIAVLHYGHSTSWEKLNEFQDVITFYHLTISTVYLGDPSEIWIRSFGKVIVFPNSFSFLSILYRKYAIVIGIIPTSKT